MKITADTNVLVRAIIGDDPGQSKIAQSDLSSAEVVALAMPTLCELVWVLSRGYKVPSADVAETIRRLIDTANVSLNRPAAEVGLTPLTAGGDFADGVIAYEGKWLGGDAFVSFDRKAVRLLELQGEAVRLLS
jgi:predicted nucleic-acid-binding protein